MNSIGRLLATHEPDYVLLSKNAQRDLVYSVTLYLFRVIDSPMLSKTLKAHLPWAGQDCIDFRKSLQVSGQVQRDFKLYAYARIVGTDNPAKNLTISEDDQKLVTGILRSKNEKAIKLVKRCRYYYRLGYKPKSSSTFTSTLNTVISTLDVYCSKFVNKKFLFLTQSGQLGKEDIKQGLLEFGVYAIYKAYPVIKTSLHMLNIAKTAIHNRGMNLIKEQTTHSRARLCKQKDGTFVGSIISLGQLLVSDRIPDMGFGPTLVANSLVTGLDGRTVEGEQFTDVNRRIDLEETVEKICSELKSKKHKEFVILLMGVHDDKFSEWLGQPNDSMSAKVERKVYANKIIDYLDIPVAVAKTLVAGLRTRLSDFRN